MSEMPLNALLDLRRQFLSFVRNRVQDEGIAEDILQTAYLRALQHGSELRENESAVAWFYRILRNAVIDYYRRRTTEGAALERWAHELETETVPNESLHAVTCSCIDPVINTLTPNYAALLREVDLGEGSLTDFATRHGISPGNAAVRAHRARTALRKKLIRTCGSCAEHGCIDCTCRHAS